MGVDIKLRRNMEGEGVGRKESGVWISKFKESLTRSLSAWAAITK